MPFDMTIAASEFKEKKLKSVSKYSIANLSQAR